jgi:catechol 2,3-dioxygenase-like lactoylglutathione lyase family enzyme
MPPPPRGPEFRGAFFSRDYEASVAFYRDGLALEPIDSWDRGPDDRGTMFRAGSGIVEVLARPAAPDDDSPWDHRSPQGIMFVVEVPDVEAVFVRARDRGLRIADDLRTQPWGHRAFCVTDPDGITLYLFSPQRGPDQPPGTT